MLRINTDLSIGLSSPRRTFWNRDVVISLTLAVVLHLVGFGLFTTPLVKEALSATSQPVYVEVAINSSGSVPRQIQKTFAQVINRPRTVVPPLAPLSQPIQVLSSRVEVLLSGVLAEQTILDTGTSSIDFKGIPVGDHHLHYAVQADGRSGKMIWSSLINPAIDPVVREVGDRIIRAFRIQKDAQIGIVPGELEILLRVRHD